MNYEEAVAYINDTPRFTKKIHWIIQGLSLHIWDTRSAA